MATVKPAVCKCGNKYIDFNNQLGCCPKCHGNTILAMRIQDILKKYTYMETDLVLAKVLVECLTKQDVVSVVKHDTGQRPASGIGDYIRRLWRR